MDEYSFDEKKGRGRARKAFTKTNDRSFVKPANIFRTLFYCRYRLMYQGRGRREVLQYFPAKKSNPMLTAMGLNAVDSDEMRWNKDEIKKLKKMVSKAYSMVKQTNEQALVRALVIERLGRLSAEQGCTLNELKTGLPYLEDFLDATAQRRVLKQMVEAGILWENKFRYGLTREIFPTEGSRTVYLHAVCSLIQFMECAIPFPGTIHSLLKVCLLNGFAPSEASFECEHGSFHQVFDEYILYTMLNGFREAKAVEIDYFDRNSRGFVTRKVLPLRAVYDCVHGRVYFIVRTFAIKPEDGYTQTLRADRICRGTILKDSYTEEQKMYMSRVEKLLRMTWDVSSVHWENPNTTTVRIHFLNAPQIAARVCNERRHGICSVSEDGKHIDFRIDVPDPLEMVPWIRSFGKDCTVLEPVALVERIENSRVKTLALYARYDEEVQS